MEASIRGIIKAVCISEKKGTEKHPVNEIVLKENFGIEGDAHAGKWHRQVSLLSAERWMNSMRAAVMPLSVPSVKIFW